ncbi:MAG: hypothetical protein ACJAZ0_000369 [Halioglobus sp.]|jgi:hypothetical protein
MVLGTSAGHGALTGMLADLIIMVEGSAMFTAGPPLVQAALGITASPEELGGAKMHISQSGVAHYMGKTEQECFAIGQPRGYARPRRRKIGCFTSCGKHVRRAKALPWSENSGDFTQGLWLRQLGHGNEPLGSPSTQFGPALRNEIILALHR